MKIVPPRRVTHTYTQTLDGPVSEVLPLLCPVREAAWVPGWSPKLVLTESGFAEPDCIFTTPDAAGTNGSEAIWTVLNQDRAGGSVEMLKVTPGFLVVRLWIVLRPRPEGGCYADVTYRYTALTKAGEEYVASRTAAAYAEFMREWEHALNGFLNGGRM